MAERRMFAKTIIDSDAFLDMPLTTQALYFHLSMRADDDGFINNAKKILRMIGASDDDLLLLISKRFIIPFESGIVVIKHWRIHNYIRTDRYKETVYQEEKSLLDAKGNNAYTLCQPLGIPNGYQMDTQVRLGKDSIGKDSIGKDSIELGENSIGAVATAIIVEEAEPSADGKRILKEYSENIDSLTPMIEVDLLDLVSKFGYELVHLALVEAVSNGVNKFQYIDSVLNAWSDAGVKTPEDVKGRINKHCRTK